MADDKYATLFKKLSNLELKVFSYQDDNNKELKSDTRGREVLGSIHFSDPRKSVEILKDFTKRYLGGENSGVQKLGGELSFVEYPLTFEFVITQAFFKYFSEMPLH